MIPIILGNAPSSGSTLLASLLSKHPEVAGGSELSVFDKSRLFELGQKQYSRKIGSTIEHGHASHYVGSLRVFTNHETYGYDKDSLIAFCRSFGSYKEMLLEFGSGLCSRKGAAFWLEKTPPNIFNFPFLMDLFPEARFIQIVRDGRDAVASFLRRHPHPLYAVARWYCANLAGQHLVGNPRFLRIRYEDLVQFPELTLREVCGFVGINFRSQMLDIDNGRDADRLPTWKNSPLAAISTASIGRHTQSNSPIANWVWRHLRLTKAGQQLCCSSSRPIQPIELQQVMGYATDRLGCDSEIPDRERSRMARHLFKWGRDMLTQYRTIVHSPVTLNAWQATPSLFHFDCFNPRTLTIPVGKRLRQASFKS